MQLLGAFFILFRPRLQDLGGNLSVVRPRWRGLDDELGLSKIAMPEGPDRSNAIENRGTIRPEVRKRLVETSALSQFPPQLL